MKIERILTPSDQLRVRDILARLSARSNRNLTLSDLIDEWSRFVVSVKQGYNWSMESYSRDLAVRDLIEEISEALSMDGRRLIEISVKDTDDDFIQATHDPDQPDQPESASLEIAWWQFRVPKKPSGKLLTDLKKMGYLVHEPADKPPEKSPDSTGLPSATPESPSPPDYEAPPASAG